MVWDLLRSIEVYCNLSKHQTSLWFEPDGPKRKESPSHERDQSGSMSGDYPMGFARDRPDSLPLARFLTGSHPLPPSRAFSRSDGIDSDIYPMTITSPSESDPLPVVPQLVSLPGIPISKWAPLGWGRGAVMVMLIEFEADEVVSTSMQSREYVKTILTHRSSPSRSLEKLTLISCVICYV